MGKIVIIDNRVDNADQLAANCATTDVVTRVNAMSSLPNVIQNITSFCQSHSFTRFHGLYIASHGSPGHMMLGMDGLHGGNVPALLGPLRQYIDSRVVLWGCNVAADHIVANNIIDGDLGSFIPYMQPYTENGPHQQDPLLALGTMIERIGRGYVFMHSVARTLGVPVLGGINTQWVQANWQFVGPWVLVQPWGSYILSDGTMG